MKALFEACVPRPLQAHFPDFEVATAQEKGWERLSNGKLLAVAEHQFDVVLTVDRGMRYQQPTHKFDVGLVVARVNGNHVRFFLPIIEDLVEAIKIISPGDVITIEGHTKPPE